MATALLRVFFSFLCFQLVTGIRLRRTDHSENSTTRQHGQALLQIETRHLRLDTREAAHYEPGPITAANRTIAAVEALRNRILAAEKNVTHAELDLAALWTNVTDTKKIALTKYAKVGRNYERLNHVNLVGSESDAEMDLDNRGAKEFEEIAKKVLEVSAKVKNQTTNTAQPQNVTEVETLRQKLMDATNGTSPESIDKFKKKIGQAEEALNQFQVDLSQAVHKVMVANNSTLEKSVKKIARQLKRMHDTHREMTGADEEE